MFERWRLKLRVKLNNGIVLWAGVLGVGLLPCPDCAAPLAVQVWPVAAVFLVYRRLRRRGERKLDLLLTDDLKVRTRDSRDTAHD